MIRSEILHVGMTVSDLDRTVEFYCGLFGLRKVSRGQAGGEQVATVVGIAHAEMRIAMLAGENLLVELIQYTVGNGQPAAPSTNDIGSAHVCLSVDDIDAVYRELYEKGVEFVAPPSPPLDDAGTRVVFVRDPDGIPVELLQPGRGGSLAEMLAADELTA